MMIGTLFLAALIGGTRAHDIVLADFEGELDADGLRGLVGHALTESCYLKKFVLRRRILRSR